MVRVQPNKLKEDSEPMNHVKNIFLGAVAAAFLVSAAACEKAKEVGKEAADKTKESKK